MEIILPYGEISITAVTTVATSDFFQNPTRIAISPVDSNINPHMADNVSKSGIIESSNVSGF